MFHVSPRWNIEYLFDLKLISLDSKLGCKWEFMKIAKAVSWSWMFSKSKNIWRIHRPFFVRDCLTLILQEFRSKFSNMILRESEVIPETPSILSVLWVALSFSSWSWDTLNPTTVDMGMFGFCLCFIRICWFCFLCIQGKRLR